MSGKTVVTAMLLFVAVVAAHILFQNQLVSFVIAPLVLATWFALTPNPPEWGIVILILTSELLVGTPPGAITAAILFPLIMRPLRRRIEIGISPLFLLLVTGITFVQLAILLIANSIHFNQLVAPWPTGIYAVLGSSLASFLVCVIWYELVVGYTAR